MCFAFFFARRYLFAPSRMGAVGWVSGISVVAIAVVTAALVCVLSVFNGYVVMILGGADRMDPELIVTPLGGAVLSLDDERLKRALASEEIASSSAVLSSMGMLRLGDRELMVEVYGVDEHYDQGVIYPSLEALVYDGAFLSKGEVGDSLPEVVLGIQLAVDLGVRLSADGDTGEPRLYFPRRKGMINPLVPSSAFRSTGLRPVGVLQGQREDFDRRAFVSLGVMRELLDYSPREASHVALRLKAGSASDKEAMRQRLEQTLGEAYKVLDREEQQPELTLLIRAERMMVYVVMLFVLVLAAFNLASGLVMLVLEKRGNLMTLRAMGATSRQRGSIFAMTGLLISLLGIGVGLLLGLALSYLQQTTGLLEAGQGVARMPFPIDVRWGDILLILPSALVISLTTTLLPSFFVREISSEGGYKLK